MNLMESVRIALRSLAANKLRSSLTMLGIIIGVAAVIALMGVGRGASAAIDSQINSMGTNLLFVSPGSTSSSGVRSAQGSAQTLTYEDALALNDPENLSAIKAVAPQVQSFGQVVYQANNTNTQIIGVTADYGPVRNYTVQDGEFITEANVQAKSSVAVLGANVASTLFGDESPVGQTVRINNITFKVIGLLTAKGGSGMGNQDDMVVVPITTAMSRLSRNRRAPAMSSHRSACRWSMPSRWTQPSSRSARCCASGTRSATKTTSRCAASRTCWNPPPRSRTC